LKCEILAADWRLDNAFMMPAIAGDVGRALKLLEAACMRRTNSCDGWLHQELHNEYVTKQAVAGDATSFFMATVT
jgi:hypothetical protein